MKILSYRRFALWWQLAMDWFQRQFAAIAASIDFTPVEEKLDSIDEKIGTPATGQATDLFAAIAEGGGGIEKLEQFFGVTLVEGYEFMTDTEVCEDLEDIMQLVDPNLTAAQAAAITEQTLNNPSES